ncbi:MAG TPA: uridine diphosphate-N-acetylglucosamine-binding protein YvcK [Methylomirabilota bacterium]|jgi:uncharacterized cofD-like protein|nr:uridine diphosphate-N-acetylglucosamine-binding protein YvcK [Methylomirabilota bacterium]
MTSQSSEFAAHLERCRWNVKDGAWLLAESPAEALRRNLQVVALGGGTGLPVVLRGLKAELFPTGPAWVRTMDPRRLTAIVTVADDGGSSGRLRRAYRIPAAGDVRNCLVALSDGNPVLARLFDFRFGGEAEPAGHSLGNLILTALSQLGGGFDDAVEQGGRLLTIQGQVVPATVQQVTLRAEFADGTSVEGESRLAEARGRIRRIHLEPAGARALPQALAALDAADLIVIGPGSLYTSLLPVLLVREIADAIAHSRARVVLVVNLMTEPGETDRYTAVDHLDAIRAHVPDLRIHDALLNSTPLRREQAATYAAGRSAPVPPTPAAIEARGTRVVARPLLAAGRKIRHDPEALAHAILDLGPLQEESSHV